jgi:hypothetical protein
MIGWLNFWNNAPRRLQSSHLDATTWHFSPISHLETRGAGSRLRRSRASDRQAGN